MDSHQHDSSGQTGGFWFLTARILSIALVLFALLAGGAFIVGGFKLSRAHGPKPAVAVAAPAAPAPTAPASPAAPAPSAPPAATASANEIIIKPGADNPLTYDIKNFTVKAGQKVKVTFNNQSAVPQPHNLILGKIGSKDRLMAAAANMVTDPNGMSKGYIPESPDIIVHTKLLNPGQRETLEFTAPEEKGDYPYLCSFPGHSILMNGVMKVE